MPSTTRTSAAAGNGRRYATALVALLVGGLLLAVGGAMTLAAIEAAPGDDLARGMRGRQPVNDEQLLRLAETRRASLAWYPDVERRRELAAALSALAPLRADPAPYFQAAAEQEREVLRLAPGNPADWLHLALLQSASGDDAAAVRLLSVALLTGADMPRLRIGLLDLGFALWPRLSGDTRSTLLQVIRHAWRGAARDERHELLVTARARNFLPLTVMVLTGEPGLEQALARLGS